MADKIVVAVICSAFGTYLMVSILPPLLHKCIENVSDWADGWSLQREGLIGAHQKFTPENIIN